MLREVSDLSSLSYSEDEFAEVPANEPSVWKSCENPLTLGAEGSKRGDSGDQVNITAQQELTNDLLGYSGQVRFNTAFEPDEVPSYQDHDDALPASWSACDNDDLGQLAAALAAAGSFTADKTGNENGAGGRAAEPLPEHPASEAEDMLGMGTVDLRTCTLVQMAPVPVWNQQVRLNASFSQMPQVGTLTRSATDV